MRDLQDVVRQAAAAGTVFARGELSIGGFSKTLRARPLASPCLSLTRALTLTVVAQSMEPLRSCRIAAYLLFQLPPGSLAASTRTMLWPSGS
jgi:hypothetical protein